MQCSNYKPMHHCNIQLALLSDGGDTLWRLKLILVTPGIMKKLR